MVLFFIAFICLIRHSVEEDNYTPSICKVIGYHDKPQTTPSINLKGDSFTDFIKSSYTFADKSLLIEFLLEILENNLVLITAPPGWGKSINLGMVEFFLRVNLTKDGKIIPPSETQAYKFFVEGKIQQDDGTFRQLEQPPLISTKHDIIKTHLAQHPVIRLNFDDMKSCVSTFNDFLACFQSKINNIFSSYPFLEDFLLKRAEEIKDDLDEFEELEVDIANFKNFTHNAGPLKGEKLSVSIQLLSKILQLYFGKKPILLFDDYDIIHESIFISKDEIPEGVTNNNLRILKMFYAETFKRAHFYGMGVITGTSQIKTPDLGGIETDEIMVIRDAIDPYYGLIQQEVDMLLSANDMSKHTAEVKQWYDGYHCLKNPAHEFYDVRSVSQLINNRQIKNYWNSTGFAKLIFETFLQNLHLKFDLLMIVNNNSHVPIFKEKLKISGHELRSVTGLFKDPTPSSKLKIKHDNREALLGLLATYGFLKITPHEENDNLIYLSIPNNEIRSEIIDQLDVSIVNLLSGYLDQSIKMAQAMEEFLNNDDNESEKLKESINALYQQGELLSNIKQQLELYYSENLAKIGVKDEKEAAIHEIMLSVLFLLKKRSTHPLPTEFQYNGRKKDAKRKNLFFYNKNRVMMIELKSNSTVVLEEMSNQTILSRSTFFQEKKLNFEAIKFLGVSLSKANEIEIVSMMKWRKELNVLNASINTTG